MATALVELEDDSIAHALALENSRLRGELEVLKASGRCTVNGPEVTRYIEAKRRKRRASAILSWTVARRTRQSDTMRNVWAARREAARAVSPQVELDLEIPLPSNGNGVDHGLDF